MILSPSLTEWPFSIARPDIVRLMARAIALLLGVLTIYGVFSAPTILGEWGIDPLAALPLLAWIAAAAIAPRLTARAPERDGWIALAALLIALRLGPLLIAADLTPVGDALAYPQLAAGLLNGEGLHVVDPSIGMDMRGFYPPVFPLLLAAWASLFGFSPPSYFSLNLLIDGAAAALMIGIATHLGHRGAGRAAAWLYLIWPTTVLAAPFAQKEGLSLLLVLALAALWLRIAPNKAVSRRRLLAIGVTSGLLILTQPGFAPLCALIGLAQIERLGITRILRIGATAAMAAVIVLLPWWVRNAVVFHSFVPLTSAGGVSLWVGNNPDATGNWLPTPPNRWGASELDYGRMTAALAKQWIIDNPGEFVRLTVTKFVRAVGISHFEVVRFAAGQPTLPPSTLARMLPLNAVPHLLLLASSSAALWFGRDRLPRPLILLLVAALVQLCLFGVWFEFGERHRAVLTPLLMLIVTIAAFRPGRTSVDR